MSRKTTLFIIFLTVLAVFAGVMRFVIIPKYLASDNSTPATQTQASPNPSLQPQNDTVAESKKAQERQSQAKIVLTRLTSRQKVAQTLAYPILLANNKNAVAPADKNWLQQNQPGFISVFGKNLDFKTVSTVSAELRAITRSETAVPPFLAVDHEGGKVQRLNGTGFTKLPSWQEFCQRPVEERQALLATSAAELSDVGIDVVWAPVVDVASETQSWLGDRLCGQDRELIRQTVEDWNTAFEKQQILSVIKHYPGIGNIVDDPHTQAINITEKNDDHPFFVELLQKYPYLGVMTTHVSVGQDAQPCSLDPNCLFPLQQFPDQLIFSDSLTMESAKISSSSAKIASSSATPLMITKQNISDVAVLALTAGNNVLVFGPDISEESFTTLLNRLTEEYDKSSNFKTQIDQSVIKIIAAKLRRAEVK